MPVSMIGILRVEHSGHAARWNPISSRLQRLYRRVLTASDAVGLGEGNQGELEGEICSCSASTLLRRMSGCFVADLRITKGGRTGNGRARRDSADGVEQLGLVWYDSE